MRSLLDGGGALTHTHQPTQRKKKIPDRNLDQFTPRELGLNSQDQRHMWGY